MSKREPRQTKREKATEQAALSKLSNATFPNYEASIEGVCEWARAENAAGRKLETLLAMVHAKDPSSVAVTFGDLSAGAQLFAAAGVKDVAEHLKRPAPNKLRVLVSDAEGDRCLTITLAALLEKNNVR